MIVETYKGCKIRAVKGKGYDWGKTHIVLNGVEQGAQMGDPEKVIASIKATIDYAEQTGPAEARFSPEWYTPGTYEMCDGHVKPIGGPCGHTWCVNHREDAPKPEPDLHYTLDGIEAACGIHPRTATDDVRLAFDAQDDRINCAGCRTFLAGLRAGKGGE